MLFRDVLPFEYNGFLQIHSSDHDWQMPFLVSIMYSKISCPVPTGTVQIALPQ